MIKERWVMSFVEYNVSKSTLYKFIQSNKKIQAQCVDVKENFLKSRSADRREIEKYLSICIKQVWNKKHSIK